MTHTMLPTRQELIDAMRAGDFDPVESACQQGGYSEGYPAPQAGIHFDSSLKGRLSRAAFTASYNAYAWLSGLGRVLRRSRH